MHQGSLPDFADTPPKLNGLSVNHPESVEEQCSRDLPPTAQLSGKHTHTSSTSTPTLIAVQAHTTPGTAYTQPLLLQVMAGETPQKQAKIYWTKKKREGSNIPSPNAHLLTLCQVQISSLLGKTVLPTETQKGTGENLQRDQGNPTVPDHTPRPTVLHIRLSRPHRHLLGQQARLGCGFPRRRFHSNVSCFKIK